jgi:hypothetical protein
MLTSMNFGKGRKPPSAHDFTLVADKAECEALREHWFRADGLRTQFEVRGTSDLRTSASRAWAQVAHRGSGSAKILGDARTEALEIEVFEEWSLLVSALPLSMCPECKIAHGPSQSDSYEAGLAASRIVRERRLKADPFDFVEPVRNCLRAARPLR